MIGDFMKARMEKYDITTPTVKRRTTRNEKLYNEIQDMNIDYVDIDVNNAMDLSTYDKSKTRESYQKQRELDRIMPSSKEKKREIFEDPIPEENRIYDIDEILKLARDNKLFEENEKNRLINTEYNILTKLDLESIQNEDMKKEDIRSLVDDVYEKERPITKTNTYSKKEEDRLLSELYDDDQVLKNNQKEELNENKEEEKSSSQEEIATKIEPKKDKEAKKEEQVKEDKKEENDDSMSNDFIEQKEGKGLLIAIIVVIILILLTCGFFVYEYFFGV